MQHLPVLQQQTMTSREIAELTGKDMDRVHKFVPGIVCDAAERMYLDDGTDSDALIYMGSIVSSMLGTANAVIKSCETGEHWNESHEAISSASKTCVSLGKMFEDRGFNLSACLAKTASEALGNLALTLIFMTTPINRERAGKAAAKTYIVKSQASGLIKIGRSTSPDRRINSLSTAAGGKLDIIAIVDNDIERELHLKFSEIRVFGEWFMDDGQITSYAKDLVFRAK